DQRRREPELELAALEVVLGELVEVVVADVVARDRDFEAGPAAVALDELVDRLDVAGVVDIDRDDQRMLVRRDEGWVVRPVVDLSVVDLPGGLAFPTELGDELAEGRLVDRVTVGADEHDVAE